MTKKGYHIAHISKGVLGESSKILEEVQELLDSEKQNAKLMATLELSDLYGAIEAYLEKNCPGTTMGDLKKMSDITKRAFRSGARK